MMYAAKIWVMNKKSRGKILAWNTGEGAVA